MKAYKHLIKYSLGLGHVVSVFDGGEWEVKKSNKYKEIIDCIESVDESEIIIHDKNNKRLGWALIVLSVDDDETIADNTITEFMTDWEKSFNLLVEA